jgi:hypothetical protein
MKVLCKIVHFYKGVELMGSKQTARTDRNTEVEATPLGVKCTSFKSKRTVLVPWSNVTGCELFYEAPAPKEVEPPKVETAPEPTPFDPPPEASKRRGRPLKQIEPPLS